DRIARFPFVDLVGRAITGVAHTLGVGAGAVGAAFDQGRALVGPGAGNRRRGRFVDGEDVVAVDGDPQHAVAAGALGDVGVAGGGFERDLGRVEVVLADVDYRQVPDRCQVQSFVESSVVYGAVAEEADADAVALEQLETVAGTGR